MTLGQLLTELAQHQIAITITGTTIKTNVSADQIPQYIQEALRANKKELIETFQKPLKTFENAESLLEAIIALGGIVIDENGNPIDDSAEWLVNPDVKVITPGDEIAF